MTTNAPFLYTDSSDSEESSDEHSWIKWFCAIKGHEYFCEVDSEFALDRFNLTGLGNDVAHAQAAYDVIIDSFSNAMPT